MYGLNNTRMQNKLLSTNNLTFDRACELATNVEMAEKQAEEFVPGSLGGAAASTNKLAPENKSGTKKKKVVRKPHASGSQNGTQNSAQNSSHQCAHCGSRKKHSGV